MSLQSVPEEDGNDKSEAEDFLVDDLEAWADRLADLSRQMRDAAEVWRKKET